MQETKAKRRALLGAATALLAVPGRRARAQAAAFPTRQVTIVVPFAPGGLADVTARLLGERLARSLGRPVVIDNRPGAGGIAGARLVAAAPADGHTLLLANTNLAINPSLYRSLPYDTVAAFAPVFLALTVPNILVVRADLPARSLAELVALAKADPGRLNYASAGNGTFPHLAMVLLLHRAGIAMTHVPYNGAAPAMQAILGGQVQALSSDPPGALPHVAEGRLRALAVTSATRLGALPDLPTVAEAGLPGFEAVGWQGFVAPAGTPAEVVATLHGALAEALAAPEVRDRLANQGVAFAAEGPAGFGAFLRRDMALWASAVAASGAQVE
jgi:tripartite-type tricarboxylate transporter receptor subunit TctC